MNPARRSRGLVRNGRRYGRCPRRATSATSWVRASTMNTPSASDANTAYAGADSDSKVSASLRMRSASARTLISTVRERVAAASRIGRRRSVSSAVNPPGLGRDTWREIREPWSLRSSVKGSFVAVRPRLLIVPPPCQFGHQLLLKECEVVEDPCLLWVQRVVIVL